MIQFRHRNCDKAFTPATFAYELPPANLFMEMITRGEPIVNFPFGMTKLHKRDEYCRKTGRDYSFRELKIETFYCDKIELRNGRCYYQLSTNFISDDVYFTVSVDFETKKVRLEYIELEVDRA